MGEHTHLLVILKAQDTHVDEAELILINGADLVRVQGFYSHRLCYTP